LAMLDPVREPYAALIGFYPRDREALLEAIKRSFLDPRFGPGRLPGQGGGVGGEAVVEPLGGVAPHAGYSYSGPAAAHFYLWLAETGSKPDTVVIVGTNHTGMGGYYTTTSRWLWWETPLGRVRVDTEFIGLLRDLYPGLADDYLAHLEEHSVEVQLPFLQYIYGDGFQLVPVVAKEVTPRMAGEFAAAVKAAADRLGRRIVFIASSDYKTFKNSSHK
jgi:AmmeMemoRadiSam system protein B